MKGGYVGVDVFFVISGYLISSIIFRSLERGDFSFAEFYAHRVNRIFPALLVVFVTFYVFGYFTLFSDEFKQLGKHMAAGAGFVQNFALWSEAGYFDAESALKPMMHLWSLSIEEQFYVIYPLLIWMAWSLRKAVLAAVLVLGAFSFAANIITVSEDKAQAFFMPQTRFWELLAGALLAYLQLRKSVQLEAWLNKPLNVLRNSINSTRGIHAWKVNNFLSIVGFFLIVVAIFGINQNKVFPGWWALIPVLGACLLILAGQSAWVNRKILARRGMVFIGLISYPLYLWHWPVLSFAKIIEIKTPEPIVRVLLVLISIVLAWLTYRFIEKPIRLGAKIKPKTTALTVAMLLVMALGYLTFLGKLPWQLPSQIEVQQIEFAKRDHDYFHDDYVRLKSEKIIAFTLAGVATDEKSLFLGDSNMAQYGPRIREVIHEAKMPTNGALVIAVQNNCDILGSAISGFGCAQQISELERVAHDQNIRTFVIAASWGKYKNVLVEPGSRLALAKFFNRITHGRRLYIVKNIPVDPDNLPPDSLYKRHFSSEGAKVEMLKRASTMDVYMAEFGGINLALQEIAVATNATLISPTDYWCADGVCPAFDYDGIPIYLDNGHITASYSRREASFIDQTLKAVKINKVCGECST